MTFDRKIYMEEYQKRYADLHRHQMTVPNLRLVNKKPIKVRKSKTGTRAHRRRKPRLVYAEFEGNEKGQLSVEILVGKKRFGGYVPKLRK